jgi:hypothetical protein
MITFVCEECANRWYIDEDKKKLVQACPFCQTPVPTEEEIVVDSFEKAVLKTVKDLGPDCLTERGRFIGYLLDTAPAYKKEIKIMSNACSTDVLMTFYKTKGQDRTTAEQVFRMVYMGMVEEEGIAEQWAKLICDSLLNALHPQKKAPRKPAEIKPAPEQTSSSPKSVATPPRNECKPVQEAARQPSSVQSAPKPIIYNRAEFTIINGSLVKYTGASAHVTIPEGVTAIGFKAFSGNQRLQKVTLPSSLATIGMGAFFGCSRLWYVGFNDRLTTISARAFAECSLLDEVILPDTVNVLGTQAFCDCTNLSKVRLPNALTRLQENVFSGCKKLRTVTVPNRAMTIPAQAFEANTKVVYE